MWAEGSYQPRLPKPQGILWLDGRSVGLSEGQRRIGYARTVPSRVTVTGSVPSLRDTVASAATSVIAWGIQQLIARIVRSR